MPYGVAQRDKIRTHRRSLWWPGCGVRVGERAPHLKDSNQQVKVDMTKKLTAYGGGLMHQCGRSRLGVTQDNP